MTMSNHEQINDAAARYAVTKDPAARNDVAELAQQWIFAIATATLRGLPRRFTAEELASSANLGLLDALEKYQPSQQAKFISFAQHRIRGAIRDGIRQEDPNGRISLRRYRRDLDAADAFYKRNGRRPTDTELDAICPKDVGEKTAPVRFDKPIHGKSFTTPDRTGEALDLNDSFRHITKGLDRRERMAFTMRFRDGLHFWEIGQAIGISESRTKQIIDAVSERIATNAHALAEAV